MGGRAIEKELHIAWEEGARVTGDLVIPDEAGGMVLFAHGSGSSRFSSRNRFVAKTLQKAGLGTLLLDLLTEEEEEERRNVFDIGLLAARLLSAARWFRTDSLTRRLPIGLFGASTGAGAALAAAARCPEGFGAVVSRGGRPDLAGDLLPRVTAPTLLIVGGNDEGVLELNRRALEALRCEKDLAVVPEATHLFEEPGALEAVAKLAESWFIEHLHLPGGSELSRIAPACPSEARERKKN
jgi:pimeloyl-ACP methyl ester carboxylesterase